jgi:predicted regulator of Ras-like GTPase activity (Roadblock/LC7/MglB family)
MLDPLTALSLASGIVQFVDFSAKLVAKGNELFKSAHGADVGNNELEAIATNLRGLGERLKEPLESETTEQAMTDSDRALRKLSEQCSGVAGELIDTLDKLKVQGTSNRRWKSIRQALKCLLRKEEIDAIMTRLQQFRDELNLHILISMR